MVPHPTERIEIKMPAVVSGTWRFAEQLGRWATCFGKNASGPDSNPIQCPRRSDSVERKTGGIFTYPRPPPN